jgi:hypothetical protein
MTLSAGQSSGPVTIGVYNSLADANGSCATPGDEIWRGYLVVTPTAHPADRRLVRLRLNPNMVVDTANQAGGSTSAAVSAKPDSVAGSAFGRWTLKIGTPTAPKPASAPTLAAQRVTTAAMTSGPPVYRFDVTGATLTVPAAYAEQMTLPALLVRGSTNGGRTWTTLGSIVPSAAPTIITSQGSATAVVQLGPSTFWWENPAGAPAYTDIGVSFGTSTPPSNTVTLSKLSPPTDGPSNGNQGPQVAAPAGIATPVDSGIDQAPLSVQVLGADGSVLSFADPHYGRVYYRQKASNALVTGLLPAAGTADLIGITPYAGAAYANNGNADTGAPGVFQGYHYVATTSTQDQRIVGYLSYGDAAPLYTNDIEIHATAINPVAGGQTVASGLSLTGCADFSGGGCRLAAAVTSASGAVTPVLYADTSTGPLAGGLLTVLQATTAQSALPLQHDPAAPAHLLATSLLSVSAGSASLTQSSVFATGDLVDTTLATHGVVVPLRAVTAK